MSDKDAIAIEEISVRLTANLGSLRTAGLSRHTAVADAALAAMVDFEMLASSVYRLRRSPDPTNAALLASAEDLLTHTAQIMIALEASSAGAGGNGAWVGRYRAIWRAEKPLFLLTAVVFFGTTLIGFGLALHHPELVSVILPQGNMEAIIEKKAWFAQLNDMPLLGGLQIAANNIKASLLAFVGSGLLGLGGLAILAYNGILIGTMLGFCAVNGLGKALGEFVLGHGPLEITVIIAATFAGLLFGRMFYRRPYRGFVARMASGATAALTVLMGVLPWLVVAATVEAFISPREDLSVLTKVAIGTALAVTFWAWTLKGQARPDSRKTP